MVIQFVDQFFFSQEKENALLSGQKPSTAKIINETMKKRLSKQA